MKLNKDTKILIVGLGLIGGSYARGLSKSGYQVDALSLKEEDLEYAKKEGFIVNGYVNDYQDKLKEYDLIILALYPKDVIAWIKDNQRYFKSGLLLNDVTGVKGAIVSEINSFLRSDVELVPAHPMAGRETQGVINSDEKIFYKANFIVIKTDKNSEKGINKIKELAKVLKFKNVTVLSVEKHDEMIAFLSQLTHCIAISLMTCRESEHFYEYTGDSFRDLTRIAKINENLWCELFLENKEALLKEMDKFISEFLTLKEAIKNDDAESIKEIMHLSTARRKLFDK